MDFERFLDDSYEIITGKALYKINGGNLVPGGANGGSFEQTKYGNQAYEAPKNDNTGGSTPTAPKGGEKGGNTSGGNETPTGSKTNTNTNLQPPVGVSGPTETPNDNSEKNKRDTSRLLDTIPYKGGNLTDRAFPDSKAGKLSYRNIPVVGHWGRINDLKNRAITMQQYVNTETDNAIEGKHYDKKKGKYVNNKFSNVGCLMQTMSKIATEIKGDTYSLLEVNNNFDKNKDGLLSPNERVKGLKSVLLPGQKLTTDYYEKTLSKEILDKIASSKGNTFMAGKAIGVNGGVHWIVPEGYSINDKGQVLFGYNASSNNDINKGRNYILGKPLPGQENYFQIIRIETFTITTGETK